MYEKSFYNLWARLAWCTGWSALCYSYATKMGLLAMKVKPILFYQYMFADTYFTLHFSQFILHKSHTFTKILYITWAYIFYLKLISHLPCDILHFVLKVILVCVSYCTYNFYTFSQWYFTFCTKTFILLYASYCTYNFYIFFISHLPCDNILHFVLKQLYFCVSRTALVIFTFYFTFSKWSFTFCTETVILHTYLKSAPWKTF